MISAARGTRGYIAEVWDAWNRFWFTPADPATLSLIRLLAGSLLLYTHAVWSLDLWAFLGPEGWWPVEFLRNTVHVSRLEDGTLEPVWSTWSVFFWIDQPWQLWSVHVLALLVFTCLMLGFFTRTAAFLGYLLAISYAQRVTPGAFFGLDKTNCLLVMYLMLGPCGARYSVDRLRRMRKGHTDDPPASVSANVAIRLMQLHLCVVYLFSGIAKLEGENWQAGTAVWWAVANLEYQSLDMTWLAGWPVLVAVMTHVTVFWELFYCCLVWNRHCRPVVLLIAFGVHGGIALCMGMITFGLAMIYANLSFVSPQAVRKYCDPLAARIARVFT